MTPSILQASCAQALPEGLPAWIQLLPAGEIVTRDGRGPYRNGNPQGIVEAFIANGMPIAVDYEHQSLDAQDKTDATPAAGWIHEMEIRQGEIWARVEWTERAAAMIEAKEYRYISPVFEYAKGTGEVVAIISAGLTNRPNLYLRAVARQGGRNDMNELLERLCSMINLPVTSTPEEVIKHLQRLIDAVKSSAADVQSMAKALSLPEDTPLSEIATAVAARISAEPDPARYVPREEYDRVSGSLQTLQERSRQEAAERMVSEAITSRRVSPGMKTWAIGYATRDPEGFAAYVKAAPAIVPDGVVAPAGGPKGSSGGTDSAAQSAIEQYKAAHPGVSEKDAALAAAAANPELFRERR